MAAMMEGFIDKVVQIVTNDGRNIVGVLKGFDQTTNVILEDCNERVYSSDAGVEQVSSCPFAVVAGPVCNLTCRMPFAGRTWALHCARR